MRTIELPENVEYIIRSLYEAGYEAFAVGGCIRDTLLGRKPDDWDITTNALPEEIKKIFRHTVDTGIAHGTVTVLIYPERDTAPDSYEVTTYRIDGDYSDGRHPDSVSFTKKLSEDLRRRDFTINAMAYNEEVGIVDLFGGQKDLLEGVIRCVGDPDERFDEDALRILRAVRFSAQLGFEIEKETARSIIRHAEKLGAVSKERIYTEISKLICSVHAEKISEVFRLGLEDQIAGGFRNVKAPEYGLQMPAVPLEERYLRFALIMRGMERKDARNILTDLKSDNFTRDNAALLASECFTVLPKDRFGLKEYISGMSRKQFEDLLSLKILISGTREYREKCPEEDPREVLEMYRDITKRSEPVYMKDLVISGNDLIRAGVKPGPEVGRILSEMLSEVRRDPEHNSVLYLFSRFL